MKFSIYHLSLFFGIFWLILIFNQTEVPVDSGDGLMHFYISQASWFDATFFLNNWGKPFFILLSSTFAQFGFSGMFYFNLLVYTLTCFIAFRMLKKMEVNKFLTALFPLTLLLANDYTKTILAGLTEPLFSLILLLLLYFIQNKKFFLFAIGISIAPYLRSEGQLVLILGVIYLLYFKQFKSLLLVPIIPILYGLIGLILLGDFWWYFTKSAYQFENNIYGSGTWFHYLDSYKNYIGNIGLFLTVVALISLVYLLFQKKMNEIRFPELFFSHAVFLGIITFHSYLWANGKYGSMGLTRIATQGLPSFLLMNVYLSSFLVEKFKSKLYQLIFIAFNVFLMYSIFKNPTFPVHATILENNVIEAAKYIKNDQKFKNKIHYHHPLVPYTLKLNPFIDKEKINFYYGNQIEKDFDFLIKKNDIVFWDAQFGPREAKMPLDKLLKLKNLSLANEFLTINEDNQIEGVYIFQYSKLKSAQLIKNEIQIKKHFSYHQGDEFINVKDLISDTENNEYLVQLISEKQIENYFVINDLKNQSYQARAIQKGKNEFHFILPKNQTLKIYFWNPSKKPNSIKINSFYKITKVFPPLK